MKFSRVIFTILFFISLKTSATTQLTDLLKYNGKIYPLKEYFLEDYFTKYPDKRPKSQFRSSNLWRGYIAYFEIVNNQIVLTDLKIKTPDKKSKNKFATTFKSIYKEFVEKNGKLNINWINSIILLPEGEPKDYSEDYGLKFESYSLIEFKNGKIIFKRNFTFETYKKIIGKKYYAFLKEEELLELKKKLKK